mmetsp:Transcript_4927/g.7713  ORF Transcript_4927/g.7713 Transcript_4927/m.7713 type:complete len:164 (-) Transcript_4927:74-565(-)
MSGDGNHNIINLLTEMQFGNTLHVRDNNTGNIFGCVGFTLYFDQRTVVVVVVVSFDHLKGPMLHIGLNNGITEFASNQTLGVKDGVFHFRRWNTDIPFFPLKSNTRWCCSLTLLIGNNFNPTIFPDRDAGIGCTQINADSDTAHCKIDSRDSSFIYEKRGRED